jgi:hypothetical protein
LLACCAGDEKLLFWGGGGHGDVGVGQNCADVATG